jgi:hypothetical protein
VLPVKFACFLTDDALAAQVIAVFGRMSLVGVPRAITWTRLGAAAASGQSSITLAEAVDWRIGEEIVVSPTEYDTSQGETAFIIAVSADRKTLTLGQKLNHTHAGQVLGVMEW